MIALNSPIKPDLKKLNEYLERINSAGWYTNFGPLHNELTARLEDYLGVQNLLLISNGTAALQVAGRALGCESFVSTPFSFVATASAFLWQKDQLAFADIDRQSYNLCPYALEKALKDNALIDTVAATHVYGNPCDVKAIEQLAHQYDKKVIYDAAHAFGIEIDGNSVLNYGDASVLSFHATKVFHTIEGGAVVFKRKQDFEKAKNMINFGIQPGKGIVEMGTNAKLNEYQAAVGLVNLDIIDEVLEHRAGLFAAYRKGLKDSVEMPSWHPEANFNGAYMPIRLENMSQMRQVEKTLAANQIQSRHYFSPSLENAFTHCENFGTEKSRLVADGVLCLPLHAHMTLKEVQVVVKSVKDSGVV